MTRRGITAEDLYRFRFVADPRISPDAARVAWVLRECSEDRRSYRSHIWVDRRPYTAGEGSDGMPRWSPDGAHIAFVRTLSRDRGAAVGEGQGGSIGRTQIWLLPSDGGEARPLTRLPQGAIKSLEWSPDGSRLAFGFHRQPPERAEGPADRDGVPPLYRRITRLHYKEEDIGFLDGERDHIWIAVARTGAATQITRGDWDDLSPAWSPDSRFLVFVSNRHRDAEWRLIETDLWVVRASGGRARRLPTPRGLSSAPSWSPDGRWIAWLGHDRPDGGWGTANIHVWIVPANGRGPSRDLMTRYDRTCEDLVITDTKSFHGSGAPPAWDPRSRALTFLASGDGVCHVHRIPVSGRGGPQPVTRGALEVMAVSVAKSGRLALAISSPTMLGEIFLLPGQDGAAPLSAMRRVTQANDALFKEIALSKPERFNVRSPGGGRIQGWHMPPAGRRTQGKPPLILQIHGGPRAMYGEAFFHEFQLLASAGYSVLYTNPRGSQGYGEAWTKAIVNDWGNHDYADLMASVDAAVVTRRVDRRRLGVCGGSYGGYMTNWIVGHTKRFKAAITMRSVSNIFSFYGTSDIGPDDSFEFGGHAFDDPANYWRQSPLKFVKKIRTPLLILHSEGDLRCPVEQAEELYIALKTMKRPVEFVRFPEENHDLSRAGRPDRRVARLSIILDWWKRRL